jgi:membrane protein implicated in regulation of membrane protease activity
MGNVRRSPREQSGDEASRPARASPGVRLALALFGLVMSAVGMVVLAAFGPSWWGVALFGVLAVVTVVDTRVQARRMRRQRRR